MKHVIVGAGPAGVTAAETLRKADPDGEVTLVGGEADPPYGRMAIPYFLIGNIADSGTFLRKSDDPYDGQGIRYVQGIAEDLAADDGKLTLADGQQLDFDKLLISTGSHPIKPPIDGLDLPAVHHCWTLQDARDICGLIGEGKDVVLMGAGFIGCIIMEALALSGSNLTVIEAQDRMVPRMMNKTAGDMIANWCRSKGVNVMTSAKVTGVAEDGGKLSITVDNGETLPADLLVVATGVRSNMDFASGSGIDMDIGIKVDDHLQSSINSIYAAGDVAQGPDFSTGGWDVHAVQPTSVDHGRIAALNMAGHDVTYQGSLNMNVLDTVGLISCSFGLWQGVEGGDSSEKVDTANSRYTLLNFDGDLLVGAVTLGRTDHIGVLRGLIQSRIRLRGWKDKLMEDPNLFVEAYVDLTRT
ncbi:MAG: NAD(P)/FAD-dependent oxidoreductase [Rhodospirillaceae bacterium]|jgi:NADPH-dependent 2,4-dienoyl-CoA reductase/sulfur reductase-like enzyme|nr:NAD(P)/FAD-dependent oxidoreductase [Rhodospirillaceae bacterium]MBT4464245.1 NAD(P)/FAD-dependent oxidoreductase [Rhodospirillaceae bacterium]MBT5013789.1 NAD(P)/FAD-dependent oxidoreductase [Rhodospirillaceae bacterium]MBT5308990.1 NAD(P)/FAD-dependent oxidoreductase [Rhodospirillaceae bacterium]MBT7355507.1 NAD(P)/FAD-dependent oxidoreductase [Rhodospirillaceae bacterium]